MAIDYRYNYTHALIAHCDTSSPNHAWISMTISSAINVLESLISHGNVQTSTDLYGSHLLDIREAFLSANLLYALPATTSCSERHSAR